MTRKILALLALLLTLTQSKISWADDVVSKVYRQSSPSIVRIGLADDERHWRRTIGTGVIISEDGLILTARHNVADPRLTDLYIRTSTGDSYPAVWFIADAIEDTAIIKIKAIGLKPIKYDLGRRVVVGEEIVSIGFALSNMAINPEPSIYHGTVANTDTMIFGDDDNAYGGLIQLDLFIAPGSSGGAIVTMDGYLIALPTMMITQITASDTQHQINFAQPITKARTILDMAQKATKP